MLVAQSDLEGKRFRLIHLIKLIDLDNKMSVTLAINILYILIAINRLILFQYYSNYFDRFKAHSHQTIGS